MGTRRSFFKSALSLMGVGALLKTIQIENVVEQKEFKTVERFVRNQRTGMTFKWHLYGDVPTIDTFRSQQAAFLHSDVYKEGDVLELITLASSEVITESSVPIT